LGEQIGSEIVVLLGGIAGLIFSASKYRFRVGTEVVLQTFTLWGVIIGPYVVYFAVVGALILFQESSE
jgi:ABC-type transporter lipoprotein component MlaA